MTAQNIAWDDTVLPFQLDRSDIRGRVARLDGVLDQGNWRGRLASGDVAGLDASTAGLLQRLVALPRIALLRAALLGAFALAMLAVGLAMLRPARTAGDPAVRLDMAMTLKLAPAATASPRPSMRRTVLISSSRLASGFLIPQLTALVRNPCGAPTPPLMRVNGKSMIGEERRGILTCTCGCSFS